MNNKKAQMEINETIIVLFIFFMLLVFGIIFYANFQNRAIAQQKQANVDLEMIKIAQTVANMPELAYSSENVLKDYIDYLKLEGFIANLEEHPDYFLGTSLHYTTIIITPYDPFEDELGESIQLYDNPLEDASNRTMFVPVLLYDQRTDKMIFAMIDLIWYSR